MSKRWARTALCSFIVAASVLFGTLSGGPGRAPEAASALPHSTAPLSLNAQTPWVSAAAPWFNLSLGVGSFAGSAHGLSVNLTFYGRIDNVSELQQAISGPQPTGLLLRLDGITVTNTGGSLGASACVTAVPDVGTSTPTTGDGICGANSAVLTLGCQLLLDTCGGVYPVTVALVRQGVAAPVAHFTTFLTYQQPSAVSTSGGALRVGVVLPVAGSEGTMTDVVSALTAHRDVATSLAVSPISVQRLARARGRAGTRTLEQLDGLSNAEILNQSYVPVNVAALSEAGIPGEIGTQVGRGDDLLRTAGLKPSGGPWVDTDSTFTAGDAGNLASGLEVAGASQFVLSDADLAGGGLGSLTFAQPFTLDLGRGSTAPAAAADTSLGERFTAQPADPVLGAEQLLAGLSFVHFENPFLSDPRGVVVTPPSGWRPSAAFLDALLGGLSQNPALSPVTLSQLFTQVPVGGNREPMVRHLQPGPLTRGFAPGTADRIALARQQLASFAAAVSGAPPSVLRLSDQLLATEARGLSPAGRVATLNAYDRSFDGATGQVTLATERTVTFTAQRADIPVTVLSAAPYPVSVVVTLSSDKFTFPDGNTHMFVLNRPTTSWRFAAQARTSGDHLPISVSLRTPDGQLVFAQTVLTVRSTTISLVGVALTVLAGAVLLAWWVRTWRRSRRRRPRVAT